MSGPCSFQLSEKIGRFKLKACGNSHAERTEQKGVTTGGKAIERLHGKKRQHPTNRTTQQKLTQQHFLRFVFICYFETTHSRVQRTQVIVCIIGFFLILPDFSILYWNRYPVNCFFFSHVGLGHNAILDIRLYFLKVPT